MNDNYKNDNYKKIKILAIIKKDDKTLAYIIDKRTKKTRNIIMIDYLSILTSFNRYRPENYTLVGLYAIVDKDIPRFNIEITTDMAFEKSDIFRQDERISMSVMRDYLTKTYHSFMAYFMEIILESYDGARNKILENIRKQENNLGLRTDRILLCKAVGNIFDKDKYNELIQGTRKRVFFYISSAREYKNEDKNYVWLIGVKRYVITFSREELADV